MTGSPYTITYSYSGDANSNVATDTTTTVNGEQGDADGDAGGEQLAADVHGLRPGGDGRHRRQLRAGRGGELLTGGAATQTTAGTYAVTADFVPTDTVNYNSARAVAAGNFVIDKATPTATLAVSNRHRPTRAPAWRRRSASR